MRRRGEGAARSPEPGRRLLGPEEQEQQEEDDERMRDDDRWSAGRVTPTGVFNSPDPAEEPVGGIAVVEGSAGCQRAGFEYSRILATTAED